MNVDEATYPFNRVKRLSIFMTRGTGATPSLEGSRVLARYMREGGFAFEYLEVDGNHGSMVPVVWPRIEPSRAVTVSISVIRAVITGDHHRQ
jgi:hypothetical protein